MSHAAKRAVERLGFPVNLKRVLMTVRAGKAKMVRYQVLSGRPLYDVPYTKDSGEVVNIRAVMESNLESVVTILLVTGRERDARNRKASTSANRKQAKKFFQGKRHEFSEDEYVTLDQEDKVLQQ